MLIDKALLARYEKVAKRMPRGFKTAFINQNLAVALDELEGGRK